MEWKQIFKRAQKTGTFTDADLEKAKSWPHCAVGDNLRSRGYNKSRSSGDLFRIIVKLDEKLSHMGASFTCAVADANRMPKRKQDYYSEYEYRKQCMEYIDEAQEIYDRIQKTEPSKALIDELELTVPPASA